MTVTVRMDEETQRLLRRLSKKKGANKSEVIREAVRLLAEREGSPEETTPFGRLKDLIGAVDSGGLNLSEDTHRKFAAMLKRKHRARTR